MPLGRGRFRGSLAHAVTGSAARKRKPTYAQCLRPEAILFERVANDQDQGMVHFTLAVSDIERSEKFYVDLLGMEVVLRVPPLGIIFCAPAMTSS